MRLILAAQVQLTAQHRKAGRGERQGLSADLWADDFKRRKHLGLEAGTGIHCAWNCFPGFEVLQRGLEQALGRGLQGNVCLR